MEIICDILQRMDQKCDRLIRFHKPILDTLMTLTFDKLLSPLLEERDHCAEPLLPPEDEATPPAIWASKASNCAPQAARRCATFQAPWPPTSENTMRAQPRPLHCVISCDTPSIMPFKARRPTNCCYLASLAATTALLSSLYCWRMTE